LPAKITGIFVHYSEIPPAKACTAASIAARCSIILNAIKVYSFQFIVVLVQPSLPGMAI